jgi:hypothetical protein
VSTGPLECRDKTGGRLCVPVSTQTATGPDRQTAYVDSRPHL